jgi:outer membrane biosynthesis protein TonB
MRYHFADGHFLSHRAMAAGGILALHVLVAYLLLTSLIQPPEIPLPPMKVVFTPTATPVDPVKLVPDFRPAQPHGPIPQPDQPRVAAPEPQIPADPGPLRPETGSEGTAAAVPGPIRLIGRNQLPDTQEYYPAELRRLGVEGATNVRVCVNEAGVRQGEPFIEVSSGNPRLDAGAVNVARHGHYARSVQGDTPVGNCFRFRINFQMK